MASIGTDPNGYRRILFVARDGSRKTIRIGKTTRRQAEAFKVKVEQLIAAAVLGHPPDEETSRWLAERDDLIHARLAAVGLVKSRRTVNMTLDQMLAEFLAALTVKSSTITTCEQTRATLVEYFGATMPLREIGPLQAEKWRQFMKGKGLAEPTISKRVKTARQAFRRAVKWKLIAENPFEDVKAGAQTNRARMHFVTREKMQKALNACPDAEWRLIVVLSRIGGLRCPSEHLALTWPDADWEHSQVRIKSCKTEHIKGHEERVIPMFPELRRALLDVFEQAAPGERFVITRYRTKNSNLRTQLTR